MSPRRATALAVVLAGALAGCGGSGATTTAGRPAATAGPAATHDRLRALLAGPHLVRVGVRVRTGPTGGPAAARARLAELLPAERSATELVGTAGRELARLDDPPPAAVLLGAGAPSLASADGETWRRATGPLAQAIGASGAARQGGLVALADPALMLAPVAGSGGRRLSGPATPALVAAVLPQLAAPGVLAVRRAVVTVALDGAGGARWTVQVAGIADLGRLAGTGTDVPLGVAAALSATAAPRSAGPAEPAVDGSAATLAELTG